MSHPSATLPAVSDFATEALSALRELVGPDAEFRADQLEAIEALVVQRRRVLVVERTGWGKSAVYFVATRLLRARGSGPTLLVSPLLALMRNQIEAGERGGVHTVRIASDNVTEWEQLEADLAADRVDLLLVSPERFANPRFREKVMQNVAPRAGLLVIDEAHCISDWGHDFRPDYRRLVRVLDLMPAGVPVLCTTATANDRVVGDIVDQLGADLFVLRGTLERESLALDVLHISSSAARLAWLARALPKLPGTGIVYALTVADARRTAEWLRLNGIAARSYTGADPDENRLEVEHLLEDNGLKCVVATSALGMGYDKPDLAFVIHYQTPGSAIAYYQQVGRAGRALDRAVAIALVGDEDRRIQDYFIRTAFPDRSDAELVVGLLGERAEWTKLSAIEREVNVRRTRLENMLKILEVDGAVERSRDGWRRTLARWEYPEARVADVTAARRREQERMERYLRHDDCLMEFLRRELDDPLAVRCQRCARCIGHALVAIDLDPELVDRARTFLRGQSIVVAPRKQWPDLKKIECRAEVGPRAVALRKRRVGSGRRAGEGRRRVLRRARPGIGRSRCAAGDRSAGGMGHVRAVAAASRPRSCPGGPGGGAIATALRAARHEDARDAAAEGAEQQRPAVRQRAGRVRRHAPCPGRARGPDRRHRRLPLDADGGRGTPAPEWERPGSPDAPRRGDERLRFGWLVVRNARSRRCSWCRASCRRTSDR